MINFQIYYNALTRCHGQVVRQWSAKPSLPSSNLGGTSIKAKKRSAKRFAFLLLPMNRVNQNSYSRFACLKTFSDAFLLPPEPSHHDFSEFGRSHSVNAFEYG